MRQNLQLVLKAAEQKGLSLLVENGQPSFFVTRPEKLDPAYLAQNIHVDGTPRRIIDSDPRLGKAYLPWQIQACPLNSNPNCINHMLAVSSEIGLAYDPEHWQMTYQYAKKHPAPEALSEAEREMLKTFGYFVRKNEPIFYATAQTPAEAVESLKAPIKSVHVNGFPNNNVWFVDIEDGEEVVKMAETFPLLFSDERMREVEESAATLEYCISDAAVRQTIEKELFSNAKSVINAIRQAGHNPSYVIEAKVLPGIYSGAQWEHIMSTSRASLDHIIREVA